MIILSDIIINHGQTSGEIFINGLAHYSDFDRNSLSPSAIVLRTNAKMVPYVILLDHSIEKKDSVVLPLKTYCGKISNSMCFNVNQHDLQLVTSLDKCLLKTNVDASESDYKLSCEAEIVAYSYLIPSEDVTFSIKSSISQNMHSEVEITPMSCKLVNLDDMLISEMDYFTLSELDYHNVGTHLVSNVTINLELDVDCSEYNSHLELSTINIEAPTQLMSYDEYLLTELDKYTLSELDERLIEV